MTATSEVMDNALTFSGGWLGTEQENALKGMPLVATAPWLFLQRGGQINLPVHPCSPGSQDEVSAVAFSTRPTRLCSCLKKERLSE